MNDMRVITDMLTGVFLIALVMLTNTDDRLANRLLYRLLPILCAVALFISACVGLGMTIAFGASQ